MLLMVYSFTLRGKPCYNRLALLGGASRGCFGRRLRGAFFFAVGVKVRGGSVLPARSMAVLAILSASCLVVSGGLSLDVRLDLFPFDDFIILYRYRYINMQNAQRYSAIVMQFLYRYRDCIVL